MLRSHRRLLIVALGSSLRWHSTLADLVTTLHQRLHAATATDTGDNCIPANPAHVCGARRPRSTAPNLLAERVINGVWQYRRHNWHLGRFSTDAGFSGLCIINSADWAADVSIIFAVKNDQPRPSRPRRRVLRATMETTRLRGA